MTDVSTKPNFGPSGEIVFDRSYSRTKPDGSKENWFETTDRVIKGNLGLVYGTPDTWNGEVKKEYTALKEMMDNFEIIPGGRHLWASGVTGRQFLFNCHVSHWNSNITDHFDFTFMRLMEGGGVGTNYSSKYINRYEAPRRELKVHIVCDPTHPDYDKMQAAGVLSEEFSHDWAGAYQIQDTREGWSAGMCDFIDTYFIDDVKHYDRVYNVTGVREQGRPLVSFGGTASGPLPFAVMMHEINEVINKRVTTGEKLNPIDMMEIDHSMACCVVSGGNRRSARMAMVSWDDPFIFDFINCKQNTGKHWTTNISVVIDDQFNSLIKKMTRDYHPKESQAKQVYKAAVTGMLRDGEPGFWNHSLSQHGEVAEVVCTNPCFHPDTIVETVNGPMRIADITEPTMVYTKGSSGGIEIRKASASFITKKNAETVKIIMSNGSELIVTPDHRVMLRNGEYVEARRLKIGDAMETICRARRGWRYSGVKLSSQGNREYKMEHRIIYEGVHGTIPEGYDIDHINRDHHDNRIDNFRLIEHGQHSRLSRQQVPNNHQVHDETGKFTHSGNSGKKLLQDAIKPHRPTNWTGIPRVVAIEVGPMTDVYDITVDETHNLIANGIVAHNCGEITLQEWEACILGHVNMDAFAPKPDSLAGAKFNLEKMIQAHKLMTRFLIRASFGDKADVKQQDIVNKNRRIGVGHFGVQGFLNKLGIKFSNAPHHEFYPSLLKDLYLVVRNEARDYSFQLRIAEPVKVTTIAPTGSIAKLVGASEGIHPTYAKYFIRRIRFSTINHPEKIAELIAQGYKHEPCIYAANTEVFEFPTMEKLVQEVNDLGWNADRVVESADEISLEDMLAFQAMYQTHYADNSVSFTVNVPEGKYSVEETMSTLVKYLPELKGTTIMVDGSRDQAPYERITRMHYNYLSGPKSVEDSTDEECSMNGACPIR